MHRLPHYQYSPSEQYVSFYWFTLFENYLFIGFGCRVLPDAYRLSPLAASRATLLCNNTQASHCGGFSCFKAWALGVRAQDLWHRGLVDPSWTRDQTWILCIDWWILNHWTTREVLHSLLMLHISCVLIHMQFKHRALQAALVVKNLPVHEGDLRESFITASRRSPGGQHSNPLQYSCLENLMDRGAWWTTVHRVAKSRTDWRDLAHMHARNSSTHHCVSYRIVSLP